MSFSIRATSGIIYIVENRIFKRITAGYKTDVIYSGKSYGGLIENLSEKGVNIITDPIDDAVQFLPGESVAIRCETPPGEIVELQCIIKWSGKTSPRNARRKIGAEIIDPPWDKSEHFL